MKKIIGLLICMLLIIPGTGILADWHPGDDYKMHYPQLPDPNGWDIDATYIDTVYPQLCITDDWLCTETGPVTGIHFWGSWLDDNIGSITAFVITIYSDISPADSYGGPGEILWERVFYPDEWSVDGPWIGDEGWYDPAAECYYSNNHIYYWQYDIEHISDPFIQYEGNTYWLSISAIVQPISPTQPRWGWKTSTNHWNNGAFWKTWDELEWYEIFEPPDFTSQVDMAFVITGGEPLNHPPNTPIKPNGPSTGEVGERLTYYTSATDPDGDNIRYGWDADSDGIVDYWSNYYPSGTTNYVNIIFYSPGVYYIRVKAEDIHGAQSSFSPSKQVIITGGNNPPNTPSKPSGPSYGNPGVSYTYTTSATDPDGDNIRYGWDWNGDGTIDEWTPYYHSGSTVSISHTWLIAGTYNIQVKAEDTNGAQSDFSSPKTVVISSNSPPNKPAMPSGPTNGRAGVSYTYTSSTTDPNGDKIYYMFDWDDGTTSGWLGPYNSGQSVSASHVWTTQGTYSVKVKAIDDPNGDGNLSDGIESVWSDPLPVSMPKSHIWYLLEKYLPNLHFLHLFKR